MLYKGYVSCSSLISSVTETEWEPLLGFREESLALKLKKLQSPSISHCNIYFFVFILLSSPLGWWHLSFISLQGHYWWGQSGQTCHCCHLGVSQVLPNAWCICIAPHRSFLPRATTLLCKHDTWLEPYSPTHTQAPQRGSTSFWGNCLQGLTIMTLQPSKQEILWKKKVSSGSCPLLVNFSTNHCNSPWESREHHLLSLSLFNLLLMNLAFFSASRSSLKTREKCDFFPVSKQPGG